MVLAFGAQGHWFESCPDLIFLHLFIRFFITDFVRMTCKFKKFIYWLNLTLYHTILTIDDPEKEAF